MTLTVLALVLLIAFAAFKFYLPQIQGFLGESFISKKLSRLSVTHYKILNDLLLPSNGNTPTTQIDHVVVSNYGIFCVETKNYNGWIFGNAHQDQWTQVIYHYKKRFFNPLRQNYAHTKAIEALVYPLFPGVPIIPFVAFPSADKLKVSGTDNVGTGYDLIQKILRTTPPVLSDVDRDKIFNILSAANITDKEERKRQVRNARFIKQLKDF